MVSILPRPCTSAASEPRLGFPTTQYLDPACTETTVAKPSSSMCGHDTACCVAAVPHKRSAAKGSANDWDEMKPGRPRDICQAISLEAKDLAKIYVVADGIETIKVKA